jgi:RHS repeat-associated protein
MIKTVENRFGFAGEMMDAVTGQYYLRARFYNPVIARFLSEDTYYGDGLNLYAYCHNNPVGYVDPSGHEGLICSKKYGELKKKETEGGTLSEKEKRQIYEQMVLEEQIMLLILLRVGAELHWNLL